MIDQIMRIFLRVKSPKVRAKLSTGLASSLASVKTEIIGKPALDLLVELNRLKRGLADLELDCEAAIRAIQAFSEDPSVDGKSMVEIGAATYSIVYLCQHEEYSMREHALLGLNRILGYLRESGPSQGAASLVEQIETQFVRVYLATIKDELVLKTVLQCLRALIIFMSETEF